MAILSNVELVRRVPLFSVLTPEQAEMVADAVVKCRYKRGETLIEQGERVGALFIILSGRARVVATGEGGREVILASLRPGDHLGEMSLIDDQPHSATVRADVQTDALMLARTEFWRCLPESSPMAHALMRGMAQRLRRANQKIESLALLDVYGRVARVLLENATDDGQGNRMVREKMSRQDIAKMVGASREMVSRVMKDLEESGNIETQDNGWILVREDLTVRN